MQKTKIFSFLFLSFFKCLFLTYRMILSPILGNGCRFLPTCSCYMEEAIHTHGLLQGIRYGIYRLLKCHPWGKQGYDPVPPCKIYNPPFFMSYNKDSYL